MRRRPSHGPSPAAGYTRGMSSALSDTAPEAEAILLEGYRRMAPQEKLERVMDLNHAVRELALSRILAKYGPDLSEQERALRLASLWLDRDTMIRAFGWDPEVRGY